MGRPPAVDPSDPPIASGDSTYLANPSVSSRRVLSRCLGGGGVRQLLQTRTHNRRRWSHVFPPGQEEFRTIPGPIWRSLCQPAVLPLSTDFVPPPWVRRAEREGSRATV